MMSSSTLLELSGHPHDIIYQNRHDINLMESSFSAYQQSLGDGIAENDSASNNDIFCFGGNAKEKDDQVIEKYGWENPAKRTATVINVVALYESDIMCLSMDPNIKMMNFVEEMKDIFKFSEEQSFTMKWLDEEGDPCTISCQEELNEAIRLYEINRDSELVIHLFLGEPKQPGQLCSGETRNIYRRGAKRWRKIHIVNGHSFVAKRFSRLAACAFCSDRIWGLGRSGYKCLECKLVVHKKCHKLIKVQCGQQLMQTSQTIHSSLPPIGAIGTKIPSTDETGPKRTRSDSPATRKRGLVSVDYSNQSRSRDPEDGYSSLVSVNDFHLIRVIGRGSYAKVMLVEYKKTERIYAMKVVKKELVDDDEDIDWVQTEKHVFEQATNHPFLVGLHSCFQTTSRLFFVIEYVSGGDLMYHMQRQRRLPEDHARFYSAEICCALNFLHEKGIIYRDLKLDNVLLDSDGHIKITDYGMCKEGLRPGDMTSTFCGTPNYIAPEILRGEDYAYSVDWWALGVLLYEMLAGRSPFDIVGSADNPDQNTEDYLFQVILEKPIRIPRSLSVKAASILKGFLNKNPLERLGCHAQTGFADITSHVFFRSVNWEQLEARQVTPPFKPHKQDQYGLENFDPQFTNEDVQFTPDDPKVLENIDQTEFEGFEYINPLLMSAEDTV